MFFPVDDVVECGVDKSPSGHFMVRMKQHRIRNVRNAVIMTKPLPGEMFSSIFPLASFFSSCFFILLL